MTPIRRHKELTAIWETPPGWGRLAAVNHSVLGKRFMIVACVFFAIGGALAMVLRTQLATSGTAFLDSDTYNQFFTMHGTVMMFLFAIPMFEGLAIYLLPKILGARDMAFPRMTAYGFWCYVFGGSILIVALLSGVAPDGGWFMYTPLTSSRYSPGINSDVWLLGITFVEISALSAAIEIVVTILKLRAPGMSIDRMPIFAWYMLVTALMMLFGFPPLILASILLELERAFGLPFFDPERGGDALLWQHLFWLFGHPEVYIIFLPAAGMISTMIPTFARHPLVGYRTIIVSIIAVGFLSFGLWVHHMFTVGIPHLALAFFSAASALVAIPTGIQIFSWIATIAKGRPRFDVPMLYLTGFFVVFIIGGLTGVMLAMVPFNFQAHDTHFVVAHLHYVLVGGFIFPILAALYYWLPHLTGRMPIQSLAVPAFWLIFGGFNVTFFLMHITGLRGMPRRVFTYPVEAQLDWLNLVSSVGSFIMAAGFALFLADIVIQLKFGQRFRRNPWKARSLEWAMPTPPPAYNFASLPHISRQAERLLPARLALQLARGDGYLAEPRNGWMETTVVEPVSGRIDHVAILPKPTFLPLVTGLATFAFVLSLLFKVYALAIVFFAMNVGLFLLWTRTTGSRRDEKPLVVRGDETAPPHWQAERPPSLLAMALCICAESVFLASLLFGALFLWLVAPGWPATDGITLSPVLLIASTIGFLMACTGAEACMRALEDARKSQQWLTITVIGHSVSCAALMLLAFSIDDPTIHAHRATLLIILLLAALRSGIGAVLASYGLVRLWTGYVSSRRSADIKIGRLWHAYTFGTGLLSLSAVLALSYFAAGGT